MERILLDASGLLGWTRLRNHFRNGPVSLGSSFWSLEAFVEPYGTRCGGRTVSLTSCLDSSRSHNFFLLTPSRSTFLKSHTEKQNLEKIDEEEEVEGEHPEDEGGEYHQHEGDDEHHEMEEDEHSNPSGLMGWFT